MQDNFMHGDLHPGASAVHFCGFLGGPEMSRSKGQLIDILDLQMLSLSLSVSLFAPLSLSLPLSLLIPLE